MDTIGYVTILEANEYVATHFVATDEVRIQWESLEDLDKAVYLQRSYEAMELLPFRGRKYEKGQLNAFPRWPIKEIPWQVKAAQVENATSMLSNSDDEEANSAFYDHLWKYGVESYRIGNLSESSGSGSWGHVNAESAIKAIESSKAINLLQPYLMGGFIIE